LSVAGGDLDQLFAFEDGISQMSFLPFADHRSPIIVSLLLVSTLSLLTIIGAQTDAREKREELYRRNNIGVAYLEQYKHEDAAKEFRAALATDPGFALARINLALAYYFLNDSPKAISEAREAIKISPSSPHAHYILGATLKKERQYEEALAAFNKIVAIDPREPITNIQIGQIHSQLQQYEPAIVAFRRALAAEPYNATAAYSLAQALNRAGKASEGREMLALFQKLRATGYATTLGLNYGEQGRYAEAVTSTGAEPDLVVKDAPPVRFAAADVGLNLKLNPRPATPALGRRLTKAEFDNETTKLELAAAFSTSVTLSDFNGDRKLDLLTTGLNDAGKPLVKLWRNEGSRYIDATDGAKIEAKGRLAGGVFGDFDNDGKTDLILFGYRTLTLYRQSGDGVFTDVTGSSGLPANYDAWAMAAAWVDTDHDGDLDLYLGNFADLSRWPGNDGAIFPDDFAGQENRLFRNNGNGTFTDITTPAGLGGGNLKTTAIVATDFNNLREIDLCVVNYGAPAQLFSNQRDGSFKDVAAQVGLTESGKTLGVGAGDLNKDGFTDFYLPHQDGRDALYLSDGRGSFAKKEIAGTGQSLAAQVLDYDNDGLLDVVTLDRDGVQLRRGSGATLADPVPGGKAFATRALASGDFDNDGGIDLVMISPEGSPAVWRGSGAGKNYVHLTLAGKTSNRSGIGTKVELRSGSLAQKLEVYASSPSPAAAGLSFGLGYRTKVDALRLFWPAGILQSELTVKTSADNQFDELDRKGTSCPLLYAWNGNEYAFVTDFLGGSAIGYLTGPGQYNYPDTDEYVLVRGDQLRERDGILSLRLNNQLEEVLYFDKVSLLAVDHPAETEIYPNERLLEEPPYPDFKIYSVKAPHAPISAIDDRDQDILPLLRKIDRQYPENFEQLSFKGYAREHAITLDLGEVKKDQRTLLLLTAWIDYADSSSNLAAAQAGVHLVPPYLQVKNARGEWETVIPEMGFPAGLPKTMTVDLTGKFLCDDAHVRIVTSMRIYWDQILVDTSGGDFPVKTTTLTPATADLRWRGFPREYIPSAGPPIVYDYRVIEPLAPWKAHLGNYTRFGDVRPLLTTVDDLYVVTRNGDEIQVDFDARRLPSLPKGWKRDYLVFADGFGKDMDLNSARPETVGELPYHGMKSYPFGPNDHYPNTPHHREYLEKYNTRIVGRQDQAAWRGVK
jgi:tetratricopeptide (TPR) repeat protein